MLCQEKFAIIVKACNPTKGKDKEAPRGNDFSHQEVRQGMRESDLAQVADHEKRAQAVMERGVGVLARVMA